MNIIKKLYHLLYAKDLKEIIITQDAILEDLKIGKGLKPLPVIERDNGVPKGLRKGI